ncbi:beta-glucoside-specific PTS transporter subunit IIABC [Clostridioides difficile]
MSKKYENLAQQIIEKVGGNNNISDVYHCQTRLRFKLIDEKEVNEEELSNMEGVATVLFSGGVFQVVIGTHVKEVFEEVEKYVQPKNNNSKDKVEKQGVMATIIDFIAGTFQPVIPALSGAGMVKAVLALLMVFKLISADSQTYYILNFFADSVFYFLPILLAFTEAKKLRCNPILAASVAGIMMHPNWSSLVMAGAEVKFFEVIPFTLASYTGTVIPIILVILVQSYVEKKLEKWIPQSVKLVFVPMLTFIIMGTLALSVLGPIGTVLGGYLATFFNFLSVNASWAPAFIIGSFLPLMVMFGLHNGVAPLGVMQMADLGYDSIFGPGCLCSNMAQATASLVVSFRTKDKKIKQLATSGSITAFMGITEPTLYGVNLPKKYPLVASMIGGGIGGLYAGITHTHRFATGSSGLPAVLLYIGDNTMTFFYNIIIAMGITIAVTAVVTYLLSLKYEKDDVKKVETIKEKTETISEFKEIIMDEEVLSPLKGQAVPLSDSKDAVFGSGALGKGIVIKPADGRVVSPVDGTILTIFPTKHAMGIKSKNGAELLIHIGIDTVNLNGEHFTSYVEQGQEVKKGDLLVEANIEKIKEAGYCTEVPVVITNTDQYENIDVTIDKNVNFKDIILKLKK